MKKRMIIKLFMIFSLIIVACLLSCNNKTQILDYKYYWEKSSTYFKNDDLFSANNFINTALTIYKESGNTNDTDDYANMSLLSSAIQIAIFTDENSNMKSNFDSNDFIIEKLVNKFYLDKEKNTIKSYNELKYIERIKPNYPGLKNKLNEIEVLLGLRDEKK